MIKIYITVPTPTNANCKPNHWGKRVSVDENMENILKMKIIRTILEKIEELL